MRRALVWSFGLFTAGTTAIAFLACTGEDPDFDSPPPDGSTSSSSGSSGTDGSSSSSSGGGDACGATCSGKCVDLQTDPANCGACGTACTNDAGKGFACVAGVCGNKSVKVSMGTSSACLVLLEGTVWCWGSRASGITGETAASSTTPSPTKVTGLAKIVDIAVGHKHACALDTDGDVWCWGSNEFLETGSPSTSDCTGTNMKFCHVPRKVPLPATVKAAQLSVGAQTNCIRSVGATGGDVYCWGRNVSRIISDPETGPINDGKTPTKIAPFAVNVLDVSVSFDDQADSAPRAHVCAVLKSKQVWCWGANEKGQLGHNGLTTTCPTYCVPTPLAVTVDGSTGAPHTEVVSVRSMSSSACALKSDQSVWCWGNGEAGQLGVGIMYGSQPMPYKVTGAGLVERLEARGHNAWAIDGAGAVKGWGLGDYYNVGVPDAGSGCYGTAMCIQVPTPVADLEGVKELGGGMHASVALKPGEAGAPLQPIAWGRNTNAQLGHTPPSIGDVTCPGTNASADTCNGKPQAVGDVP